MIIEAFYRGGRLLEADIVESREGGTVDILDRMIRHQEVFLPPHEHKVGALQRLVVKRVRVKSLGVLAERLELALQ